MSLRTIELRQRAGKDGDLSLRLPLGKPDEEYEVVVVLRPTEDPEIAKQRILDLYGAIDDETFIRHPQGVSRPVEPLDFE